VAAFFFDTSSVLKRYVAEVGTGWIRSLVDPAASNQIFLARITAVEVVAAITRRMRAGGVEPAQVAQMVGDFCFHLTNEYRLLPVTSRLLTQAMTLAERHGLRGYDAVQLAAASIANVRRLARRSRPLVLVSADAELNAAATVEGLVVDDPNTHP
jgi:predicted nucleic acid-binding protein